VGIITWKSVAQSIAEVWGLHSRSLVYSVVQLFLRPGYFISDYISGKRQVSFPPVKMLAIIALLGVLVDYLTGAIDGVFDMTIEEDKMLFLDNVFMWMNTHPDLMSMILLSYLIIPNYYIFRFAPRNPHHTLPQGFFIQVFNSVIFLVLNMIYDITSMGWFVFVLALLALFFTYKQLFGYGIWGTVWRVAASLACGLLLFVLLLFIDYCIHTLRAGQIDIGMVLVIVIIPLCAALFIAILWISHIFSKPRPSKPQKQTPAPAEAAPAETELVKTQPMETASSKEKTAENPEASQKPESIETNKNKDA
jgi:hypothetical protein